MSVIKISDAQLAFQDSFGQFWEESFRFILQSIFDGFNPVILPTGFGLVEPVISATGIWTNSLGGWGSYDVSKALAILKDLFLCDSTCTGIWIDHAIEKKKRIPIPPPIRLLSKPVGPYVTNRDSSEKPNFQKLFEDALLLRALSQENRRVKGSWKQPGRKSRPEYRRARFAR